MYHCYLKYRSNLHRASPMCSKHNINHYLKSHRSSICMLQKNIAHLTGLSLCMLQKNIAHEIYAMWFWAYPYHPSAHPDQHTSAHAPLLSLTSCSLLSSSTTARCSPGQPTSHGHTRAIIPKTSRIRQTSSFKI